MRARSPCGTGAFSPALTVSLGNVPGQMSAINTSIVEPCQLRLSWVEPINNGAPIENYKIEISSTGLDWQTLPTTCDDQSGVSFGQCVTYFQMSALASWPYNYNNGDLIQIRGSA